eukprot:gene17977-24383_t
MPPAWLLTAGQANDKSAVRKLVQGPVSDPSGHHNFQHVLMTLAEFEDENGCKAAAGKRYFQHTSLPDIINAYPMKSSLGSALKLGDLEFSLNISQSLDEAGEVVIHLVPQSSGSIAFFIYHPFPGTEDSPRGPPLSRERKHREAFIDFLVGVLDMDPRTRWTPRQAAAHPFVTGAAFKGPFQPPQDLRNHEPAGMHEPSGLAAQSQPQNAQPKPVQVAAHPQHAQPPPNLGTSPGGLPIMVMAPSTAQHASTKPPQIALCASYEPSCAHVPSTSSSASVSFAGASGSMQVPVMSANASKQLLLQQQQSAQAQAHAIAMATLQHLGPKLGFQNPDGSVAGSLQQSNSVGDLNMYLNGFAPTTTNLLGSSVSQHPPLLAPAGPEAFLSLHQQSQLEQSLQTPPDMGVAQSQAVMMTHQSLAHQLQPHQAQQQQQAGMVQLGATPSMSYLSQQAHGMNLSGQGASSSMNIGTGRGAAAAKMAIPNYVAPSHSYLGGQSLGGQSLGGNFLLGGQPVAMGSFYATQGSSRLSPMQEGDPSSPTVGMVGEAIHNQQQQQQNKLAASLGFGKDQLESCNSPTQQVIHNLRESAMGVDTPGGSPGLRQNSQSPGDWDPLFSEDQLLDEGSKHGRSDAAAALGILTSGGVRGNMSTLRQSSLSATHPAASGLAASTAWQSESLAASTMVGQGHSMAEGGAVTYQQGLQAAPLSSQLGGEGPKMMRLSAQSATAMDIPHSTSVTPAIGMEGVEDAGAHSSQLPSVPGLGVGDLSLHLK